jgi:HK97 family phage portal protein
LLMFVEVEYVNMERPTLLQRAARWIVRRALSYAGVPLRDPALMELFGRNTRTQAGVYVDENSAPTLAAYYRGVALIASTVAMLRFECIRNTAKEGAVRASGHVANEFFDDAPNANMTWFQFAEMLTSYAITWGNACAYIDRKGKAEGVPIALHPLAPNQVTIGLDNNGKKVFHFKKKYKGEVDKTYEDYEILHIAGFGFDGVQGQSVVSHARESIGLGLSTERYGASFFGNNATPGFVIEHPGEVRLEGKNRIIDEVETVTGGSDRARKGVVLDEGMKYKQVGIPPEDGQFLETRQFQVREIARWLGVPPHMLYDLDNANFSTTEGQSLEFLTFTLAPWLERWIQELKRKLLTDKERSAGFTFRADVTKLIALDTNTKWEVFSKGRNIGYWTLNDIARKEGDKLLPPEVGDIRLTPSTMQPLIQESKPEPVEPQVLNDSILLIKSLGVPSVDVTRELLKATVPTASDELLQTLIRQLQTNGAVKP